VWNFLEKEGTTTDECDPYTSGEGEVPQCLENKKCGVPSVAYTNYKCAKGSVTEALSVDQIKNNLFVHGPMQTGF